MINLLIIMFRHIFKWSISVPLLHHVNCFYHVQKNKCLYHHLSPSKIQKVSYKNLSDGKILWYQPQNILFLLNRGYPPVGFSGSNTWSVRFEKRPTFLAILLGYSLKNRPRKMLGTSSFYRFLHGHWSGVMPRMDAKSKSPAPGLGSYGVPGVSDWQIFLNQFWYESNTHWSKTRGIWA